MIRLKNIVKTYIGLIWVPIAYGVAGAIVFLPSAISLGAPHLPWAGGLIGSMIGANCAYLAARLKKLEAAQ